MNYEKSPGCSLKCENDNIVLIVCNARKRLYGYVFDWFLYDKTNGFIVDRKYGKYRNETID